MKCRFGLSPVCREGLTLHPRLAPGIAKKRCGSTLIEVLIAIIIMTLMLFTFMSLILSTSQDTVVAKEVQGAYLTSLSELEKMEADRVRDDVRSSDASGLGSYTMEIAVQSSVVAYDFRSGNLSVETGWAGARKMKNIVLERQVSPSAWQNAGQIP